MSLFAPTRRRAFALRLLLPLALAALGYWSPWLAHPASALRLNGYELSEWVTFLPEARAGEVPLSRLGLLVPLACLALLSAIAAARSNQLLARPQASAGWLPSSAAGWALLGAGALFALGVFPPYPYILTAYRDPEFQAQLFMAGATLLGLAVVLVMPDDLRNGLQAGLALLGGAFAVWQVSLLMPLAADLLGGAWPLGWAVPALAAGCLWLAASGAVAYFEPRHLLP